MAETIDLTKLKDSFASKDIEWQIDHCGKRRNEIWATCRPFVKNLAIQRRLDEVVGPSNWAIQFVAGPEGGVLCRIGICIPSGKWVWKEDCLRGGFPNSMNGAASQWGIGRDLHFLPTYDATIVANGKYRAKYRSPDGANEQWFHWNAPDLPDWAQSNQNEATVPEWDSERRELRWKGRLIKRFKVPAPNQEIILTVFEEESWPPRIDDPLPPHPEQSGKRRLQDTINSLNRTQKYSILRFTGDGRAQGVCWKMIQPSDENNLDGNGSDTKQFLGKRTD